MKPTTQTKPMKPVPQDSKSLLRFLTCGSVDDGKSTLIGNLLYNSKRLCVDQIEALHNDSKKHGTVKDGVDYALLLDGLASEREQGITIDVAYRFFETPKRKFIVADTPGHEQYTRNMVTGATTCDLAIVLIDASKGILTQSRRHAFLVSLLQIPHVIVAVNKMDLVDYDQNVFEKIVEEFKDFCTKLDIPDIHFIPVSALKGDNVVEHSVENMSWYGGSALLPFLETVYIRSDRNYVDFRYPVQYVIRPDSKFRGFAGKISSGTISPGEEIMVLPSEKTSRVKEIVTYDGNLNEAFAGQSIVLTLEDEIDVSRGNMLVRKSNLPKLANELDIMICWMSEKTLDLSSPKRLMVKHTSRDVSVYIEKVTYRVDINTLHREDATELKLNDIARVQITCAQKLYFDNYTNNRRTGSLVFIDPVTNETVASGMIRSERRTASQQSTGAVKSKNITEVKFDVNQEMIEARNGHQGAVLWFTGLSGSGKSTISQAFSKRLFEDNMHVASLDGDNIRIGLCSDLGFAAADRTENIRRVAEVSKLIMQTGQIVICSFISPFTKDRDFARSIMPVGRFFEIYIQCDIDTCIARDPKGLYKKALAGEIRGFTGIDAEYQAPENPDVILDTANESVDTLVDKLLAELEILKHI
ncbi:sulfate adenylyltransferase subunit CysN [bacterium AH-315-E10]|nr:sulfate adenylyltransferase subunit CysN [bacterium AH-315-E10]